ncbi:MAG: ATP-binding cassette domain-containing protein, partial [Chloroflexi bacterium]|nr:ATP-binding cassette domain-containing protein [Chloroflexota bacterium]
MTQQMEQTETKSYTGDHLLDVKDLSVYFFTRRGVARAVDGVSFHLDEGESLGIVGESGSGKSVTALGMLRLVPPPGEIVKGEVYLEGEDLTKLSGRQMRKIRGRKMSMILQDPMTSLNP